jgi:DNA-binding CsgD family transcriptional regulator
MAAKELSPREKQIVQLTVDGFTNDGIAHELGLSIGTVNTYWLRIRLKVGGTGRTETIARIIKERSDRALRESNVERRDLEALLIEKERSVVDLRAALALLNLAMDQIRSTVWATDRDLVIYMVANGEFPSTHCGVVWEAGKTIYEIFKTTDPGDLGVAAHLLGLDGEESSVRLGGEFTNMTLRVMPLQGDGDEVLGCISILNVGTDSHVAP